MIVNFYEPSANFELPPEKAIDYFAAKGLQPTFNWFEMLNEQHDAAFTVAKMMDLDLLNTVRMALDDAITNGKTLNQFKKELIPTLQKKGWWGVKDVIDPETGNVVKAQLGSASRLETIFRTNLQTSYAAGHWQSIVEGADAMPYLMYDAVDDYRTRSEHRALDGRVFPIEHKFWLNYYPPNGWNCRCGVIQMTSDDVKENGLKIGGDVPGSPYPWTNPATGKTEAIPFGIDPGFNHNSGISLLSKLKKQSEDKIKKYQPETQPDAIKGMKAAEDQAKKAKAAQKAAEAKKAADEAAKKELAQAASIKELEKIAAGQADKQAGLKQKILAKAIKAGMDNDLPPEDLLAYVVTQAAQEQAKKELASTINGYKKKVVDGKLPSKSQQAAFDSLDDTAKAKVLADIDKAKAKAAEGNAPQADAEPLINPESPTGTAKQGLSMADMKQIGGQSGSNPGGLYYDESTGIKWYIKEPKTEAIARNELVTAKLYEAAGVEVPEIQLIKHDGKTLIASRIIDGLAKDAANLKAGNVAGVLDSFVVDAWLANWDVVGLVYDNMLVKGGRAIRLDTGGGLLYRAQGGAKGQNFTDKVGEIESMVNPNLNASAASVFKHATREDLITGARKVLSMTDKQIAEIVDQYGPGGAIEKGELIKKLITRREDIRRQFPEADAKQTIAPKTGKRLAPEEVKRIKESRANGYSILTDKDAIEDHSVMVTEYTDAKGQQHTKLWLRLHGNFRDKFEKSVTGSETIEASFDPAEIYQAELSLAKGINMLIDSGQAVRQKDLDRIAELKAAITSGKEKLKDFGTSEAAAQTAKLDNLLEFVESYESKVKIGELPPAKWPSVEKDKFSPMVKSTSSGVGWKSKLEGYEIAAFERSNIKMTGTKHEVMGVNRWHIDDRDGVKARYLSEESNAYSVGGYIEVSAKGTGDDVVDKLFNRLDEYNIDTSRARAEDREVLYLNKIAKLRLINSQAKMAEYGKLKTIQEKIDYLEKDAGWEFTKSPEYDPNGFRQAFEHGRQVSRRPDIPAKEWEKFEKDYMLYHNPLGLSIGFSQYGAGQVFVNIIRGGGQMSSFADRVRRGVLSRAASAEADLASGGANYIFTRIQPTAKARQTAGFWWKSSHMRRTDAISYDHDAFGKSRDDYQRQNRISSIRQFKEAAKSSGNETIFKDSLSFFDDLDAVVFPTKDEADWVIAELKKEGYTKWPDGRQLHDVIRYTGQT